MPYDPNTIEPEMQKYWQEIEAFKTDDASGKPKKYILDMFPYPSGAGLHVGHVEGYSATDIVARYYRMNGFEVLHPMGWDAFGLPAENYAIKVNKHPRFTTDENIQNFTRQINSIGKSIDWSREVDTSAEDYYKWTQWFFLLMYKNKLAYRKEAPVNWCENDQTVLANEQVVDGKCERCKNEIVQKDLAQWFFKVTEYADRLLDDLDQLDWPEALKQMQRNWIGRSEGAELTFEVKGLSQQIDVFTTRPDTLMGATYLVLAPEHPLVEEITTEEQQEAISNYVDEASRRSELERTGTDQKKTGVFTGAYALHPITGEELPIWIADYVLTGYGTGAIMAVPAHDERDHAFAIKYELPIIEVIKKPDVFEDACYTGDGVLVNSGEFNDLDNQLAKKTITDAANGQMTKTYRIRDWLLSRQRFWGAPIPIIYCDDCGVVPVPEKDLPVVLPKEADFKLSGDGKSPLARVKDFVETTCPTCEKPAKRETDTMDGFVDNSWYYYRYLDPKNEEAFASKEKIAHWMPIDLYVGGAEHAVGHLIYSRFFTKVLKDQGYLDFEEPFTKLVNQGLILAEDGVKMSKSLGNVINPDDVVAEYGADALRLFEMFLGPLQDSKPWDTKGIVGVKRFLEKVYRLFEEDIVRSDLAASDEITAQLHRTIKKVTDDIEKLHFNTAIASMMEFVNAVQKKGELPQEQGELFLKLLSPFAPHIAEYLWKELGHEDSLGKQDWPTYDERLLVEEETVLAVQVNGKVRDKILLPADADEAAAKAKALESENVQKHLEGKEIKKAVYVQGRILNLIV